MKEEIKIPGILCDVDGVLVRGEEAIEGSREALMRLKKKIKSVRGINVEDLNLRIPISFITNNGGNTEYNHTKKINRILKFSEEDPNKINHE